MYQRLTLIGNLGKDPEMRYTPQGTPVTSLSVATSNTYKVGEETKNETTWWRVSVWGKQAETVNQYLTKGSKVLVEGVIQPGADGTPKIWTGSDGTPHASYEVRASTVRFLSKVEKQADESVEEGE